MKNNKTIIGYTCIYNLGTLNYFNPKLQLKDTEFADRYKLKNLFTELTES